MGRLHTAVPYLGRRPDSYSVNGQAGDSNVRSYRACRCSARHVVGVTATDRSAVAIAHALNGTIGQVITITIRNARDADLGGLTWGPRYKLGGWVSPANGGSRSISFGYDGAHWIEIGRIHRRRAQLTELTTTPER
jgi:hypothetical protein